MISARLASLIAVIAIGMAPPACASIHTVKLNPRATYLQTASDSGSLDATPIALASLPFAVSAGDFLRLERLGDFSFFARGDESGRGLSAVFSSTSELLPNSNLNRVAGAIDAGTDYSSGPNFLGGPNDIAADFFVPGLGSVVTSVIVQVPVDAAYLFFSASDSQFGDNLDIDNNFAVSIERIAGGANPEASAVITWSLLGLVAGGFRFYRRPAP
jgi:hypothetical protein